MPEKCGEVRLIAGRRWVCTRPPHAHYEQTIYGWRDEPLYVIDHTDKHWFKCIDNNKREEEA